MKHIPNHAGQLFLGGLLDRQHIGPFDTCEQGQDLCASGYLINGDHGFPKGQGYQRSVQSRGEDNIYLFELRTNVVGRVQRKFRRYPDWS